MKRRARRPPRGPANLAARALGGKIFGLKVVMLKKRYSRKLKHKSAITPAGPGKLDEES